MLGWFLDEAGALARPVFRGRGEDVSVSYRCATCGTVHDGLLDIASDRPDQLWGVSAKQRGGRVKLTSHTCVIDDEDFFIRGVLEIRVHDARVPFAFGVRVSQKRENFHTYLKHFRSAKIGPFTE